MLCLLLCRSFELRLSARSSGSQRLALVKGLRACLADVVDTHERRSVAPRSRLQVRFRQVLSRNRTNADGGREQRPQPAIETDDKAIEIDHLSAWFIPAFG